MMTPKKERFCKEYVIDLNGTQAAIRAGYSTKTAKEQAARLLTNVNVQARVKELQGAIGKRLDITAEKVVQEFAKIGFSNIQDYIEVGNEVMDLKTIEPEKAAAVESITTSVTEFGSGASAGTKTKRTFKLHSKVSALENLGKHLGIFEKDNSQQAGNVIRVRFEDDGDNIPAST